MMKLAEWCAIGPTASQVPKQAGRVCKRAKRTQTRQDQTTRESEALWTAEWTKS